LDATGCACDAGPATTETAARLANVQCKLGTGGHFYSYGVYPGLLGIVRIYRCFATSWTQIGCLIQPHTRT
jgi:hypothetical protein